LTGSTKSVSKWSRTITLELLQRPRSQSHAHIDIHTQTQVSSHQHQNIKPTSHSASHKDTSGPLDCSLLDSTQTRTTTTLTCILITRYKVCTRGNQTMASSNSKRSAPDTNRETCHFLSSTRSESILAFLLWLAISSFRLGDQEPPGDSQVSLEQYSPHFNATAHLMPRISITQTIHS
jgi:hypothetical protein